MADVFTAKITEKGYPLNYLITIFTFRFL